MTPNDKQQDGLRKDLLLAGVLIVAGVAISGLSLVEVARQRVQVAQATPPLQSTPGAESKPSAPSPEPATTGARPHDIAPEPARPDADAQDAGAKPALPPAPAEKQSEPIKPKT